MSPISNKQLNEIIKQWFSFKVFLNLEYSRYEADLSDSGKAIVLRVLNLSKLIKNNDFFELDSSDKWNCIDKYPKLQNSINDFVKIKSGSMVNLIDELYTLSPLASNPKKSSNNEGLSFLSFNDPTNKKNQWQLIEKDLINDIAKLKLRIILEDEYGSFYQKNIESINCLYKIKQDEIYQNLKLTNIIFEDVPPIELIKTNLKTINSKLKSFQNDESIIAEESSVFDELIKDGYKYVGFSELICNGVSVENNVKELLNKNNIATSNNKMHFKISNNQIEVIFIAWLKLFKLETKVKEYDEFNLDSFIFDKKIFCETSFVKINGVIYKITVETKSALDYLHYKGKRGITENQFFSKFSKLVRESFDAQKAPKETIMYVNQNDKDFKEMLYDIADKNMEENIFYIEKFNDKQLLGENLKLFFKNESESRVKFNLYKRNLKNEQLIQTNANKDLDFVCFFKNNGAINREQVNTVLFLNDKIKNLFEKNVENITVDLERIVDKKDEDSHISKSGFLDVCIKYNEKGENIIEIYEIKSQPNYRILDHKNQCENYVLDSISEVKNKEYKLTENDYKPSHCVFSTLYLNNINGLNILYSKDKIQY